MILVDSSVWVDYLRSGDERLALLLQRQQVLGHSWVTGELSLGNLPDRAATLGLLRNLPQAPVSTSLEVSALIDRAGLSGCGIGYVDVNLLASALLVAGARLWTHDRRLAAAAGSLGIGVDAGARPKPTSE